MKKNLITLAAAGLGLLIAVSSVSVYEYRRNSKSEASKVLINSTSLSADAAVEPKISDKEYLYSILEDFEGPQAKDIKEEPKVVAQVPKSNGTLSRGGTPPAKSEVKNSAPTAKTTGKAELLDWWKQAQYAFPINSVATVKDVYTGKTFKIKRTMGANHADCEALTTADTNIIKSIWGGFTWTVRPVHVIVNGRILAASMSSMPHAGVDSAPAFAVVDNRSVGYGRGENLDVVKGNGMDGHFDIHFLNSTRHKDGKVDQRHQDAIKVAASK